MGRGVDDRSRLPTVAAPATRIPDLAELGTHVRTVVSMVEDHGNHEPGCGEDGHYYCAIEELLRRLDRLERALTRVVIPDRWKHAMRCAQAANWGVRALSHQSTCPPATPCSCGVGQVQALYADVMTALGLDIDDATP